MIRFFKSRNSFNRQLSTTFIVGILILAIFSSFAISWVVSTTTRAYFVEQGIQLTHQFSMQSKLALLYGSPENAETAVKTLRSFPDVLDIAIFDLRHENILLGDSNTSQKVNQHWVDQAEEQSKLIEESSDAWHFIAKVIGSGDPELADSPFGVVEAPKVALGYVIVTLGKESLHALTKRLFFVNALISLALASLLMIALRLITKRLTTPIENLSDIMMRAEKGETGIRSKLDGPKDIVLMGQAFNKMMSVIEEHQSELKDARDAAIETAKTKAEFAAVVSHEIRTPLNGVLGMLNLLQEVGVPEMQRQYLNVAIQSGDALLNLINDILDFSKIEAGKLELESTEFDLRICLEDVLTLFIEQAQTKEIELCLDIPADLPPAVTGDSARLTQVLTNLLGNAIKFTEQGEVFFSVSFCKDDNNVTWFKFSVIDTGLGIPLEAQQRIFDSFSQADTTTTRKYGGTGLGLTICKRITQLLGGHLEVESEPERGSEFFFSIPMTVTAEYFPKAMFADTTCLILDRNEHNRHYLANTLMSFGCYCVVASDEDELFQIDNNDIRDRMPYGYLFINPNACHNPLDRFLDQISSQSRKIAHQLVLMVIPGVSTIEYPQVAYTINLPARYRELYSCLEKQSSQLETQSIDNKVVYLPSSKLLQADLQVLIVDDNRTNQLVAKAMLNESGYLADIASSGREAVAYVSEKKYELVLMDCNMPEMDGFEATRRIRALKGDIGKTPIFAMTATDNPKDLKRCLEVGMDDYLIKPLTLDVLRRKLNKKFQIDNKAELDHSEREQPNPIDTASFDSLWQAMGNNISEIVEAFLTDTPHYLADIQQFIADHNVTKITDIAHNLKGSARNLGANQFASICRELEAISRRGILTDSRALRLFTNLELEFGRVEATFKHKLAVVAHANRKNGSQDAEMVLVVDDDRSTRLTIVNVLAADGLILEQAVNGREAVDKFNSLNPDLIIMDAVMPVLNGFDASKEIKSSPAGRKTPILMITALENDESIERAFKCGAADFIPKPINLAVLRRRVTRVLDARQSEQRVERLAYIDGLTGLPNRIAFSDRLMQDMAYARRNKNQLAILFIDIDHFKDVNDNLGHAAGDELLKFLSERVGRCVRGEDTLARLGGDEFVVVLSSVNGPKGAGIVAQNLLKALSTPFQIAGKEVYVGASIGISVFPDDGLDRETLLKNADTAMYRAKALGRNNYQFYTLEMSASISERVALETDLRKVLGNNELLLYYQPKAKTSDGRVVGAEALIRWKHPTRGFLLPDEFIPIADEIGLLEEIGGWVMNTACRQFHDWLKIKSFDAGVAVNVSARQLMASSFIDNVKHSLDLTGLNAEYLELEITENTVLEHGKETIEKLKQLSNMGVKIALDDFGVGYSSFSYLKKLPVRVIKLDRSFVKDVPEDKSGAAIIDGMIKLAHNLNLVVVAEGVETQPQHDFLREHGCDIIQGHYISKPLAPDRFTNTFVDNIVERS